MNISKLIIKGFRSFDSNGVSFVFREKLTAFIGINSSGKTSALDALRKVFGNSAYEYNLKREDFFVSVAEENVDKKN